MSGLETKASLKGKYLRLRWIETILFSLSAWLIVSAIAWTAGLGTGVSLLLGLPAAAVVAFLRVASIGFMSIDNLRVSLFLNRFYPELRESSDLLLRDSESLNSLEQIQVARTSSELLRVVDVVAFPNRIRQASIALAVAICLLAAGLAARHFNVFSATTNTTNSNNPVAENKDVIFDPRIDEVSVTITAPAYTGIAARTQDNMSFLAPEGSRVTWNIKFFEKASNVRIVSSSGDSVSSSVPSAYVALSKTILASQLYRIKWTSGTEEHVTDYFRIEMKADAPPQISIRDLAQFTRLKWGEKNNITVASDVADDYGLTAASLVATVAKGSGESVKFREEKMPLAGVAGLKATGSTLLDFKKLGMEPGDEVYFYVEAFDNKKPNVQKNRTDTYFIALQDTASQEIVMDEGLGVDLMPDYFRSQRQLIIDTEKLLAEEKKISKMDFKRTSNELGYDQKVLRLRYGQFLGEEFETNIGPSEADHDHEEGGEEEKDVLKQYGHQHDTENEHNLVAEKKQDSHQHDEKDKDDPAAAFRHDHDSEEAATFFTLSIRAKLKAALTLMWDSELKLRLYQPKESLPVQYQILKLLKEISQDSRIYVHRTGFDPPPIKEDKRLTGAQDEIKPAQRKNSGSDQQPFPAMVTALKDINLLLAAGTTDIPEEQKYHLQKAGEELATLALQNPGNYLEQLGRLRLLLDGKITTQEESMLILKNIRQAIWKSLPEQATRPSSQDRSAHWLDERLYQELMEGQL